MVQRIEHLPPELQIVPLMNREVPVQREVDGDETRFVQDVAAGGAVSKAAQRDLGKGGEIEPLMHRGIGKRAFGDAVRPEGLT